MTPEERDIIIETRNDVKWLRDWATEHKQTHSNYLYYLVITLVAAVIGWFRGG